MSTDIDWQRELDASFGSRDDLPAGHYVLAGRRAVRRRRAVAVMAGLGAAAIVIGGVAWGVAPDHGPTGSEAPVATDPNGASGVADGAQPWGKDDPPARFDGKGLQIRDGAVVHDRVDNLFPGKVSESVALDITYQGARWWMTVEWEEDSGTWAGSSTTPDEGLYESFDAFVVAEMRGGGMGSEPSVGDDQWYAGMVQWAGGEPTTRTGVTVVREVDDPVSTAEDSLGLVLEKNGETTWMLITLDPSGSGGSWSQEDDSGWATFDQWLVDQVAMATGEPTPTLVDLADDSTVSPALPGVEVLDQRAHPDLRDYGTGRTGAASAVALMEWQGERWFVLAVSGHGDGPDAITTVAVAKAGGATSLDEFIAFMADRADEGGMR